MGATATGKSDLALRVARLVGGRIINADSIQVYRGLDAGSCKPPPEARREIPHYLVDALDPAQPFSAGLFARLAGEAIDECRRVGAVPIVAGGTGLYIRALMEGIAPMPPRDESLRKRLHDRAAAESPEALHAELQRVDPETAGRIGERDLQRIVRALEVAELTGEPLSRHIRKSAYRSGSVPALRVGLLMERGLLHRRINDRVEAIFRAGIVEEVKALLASGVPEEANALKALGYRETLGFLRGETDLARTMDLVKTNTRRYARRQISWFRQMRDVHWLHLTSKAGEMEEVAAKVAQLHGAAGSPTGGTSGVSNDG